MVPIFRLQHLEARLDGAHDRIRTGDLFLTKEVLCRLSYVGERETGIEPATPSLEGSRSAT